MNSIKDLLQKSSQFLGDVSELCVDWVQELQVEKSKEIVTYHPLISGHMLRPLLVYITAAASEVVIAQTQLTKLACLAASIELLHNASLLHDDLLDQEEMRRGKVSLHKAYGYKNALLAGNIFYIKAIELSNTKLGQEQTADLLKTAIDMCEGEILQAKYEGKPIPREDYERLIRYKTGKLMSIACRQASVIMKGDDRTVALFSDLGEELGLMYQLRDDRKDQDVTLESQFEYGKTISQCNDRMKSILEELSQTKKIKNFEEILAYINS